MQFARVMGGVGLGACALCVCAIAALAMGLGSQPGAQMVATTGTYALQRPVHTQTIVRPVTAASPTSVPAQNSTTPAPTGTGIPPAGEATAWGCTAALTYLNAYAAPGFTLECPASSQGHQASTSCVSRASRCDTQRIITIADPCPAAYMNEASNSWVLMGESDTPIDPYGDCP